MPVIFALVFALAIAVFAASNSVPVTIRFLTFRAETSLAAVALASCAMGAIMMGLVSGITQIRLGLVLRRERAKLRRLEHEVAAARAEVASLREATLGKCGYRGEGDAQTEE